MNITEEVPGSECNKTFGVPSTLQCGMYDHQEKWYKCEVCSFACNFVSELKQHKVVHYKNTSYQPRFSHWQKYQYWHQSLYHVKTKKNPVTICYPERE